MGVEKIPAEVRTSDYYTLIDMGFPDRRLGLQALGPLRNHFLEKRQPGDDDMRDAMVRIVEAAARIRSFHCDRQVLRAYGLLVIEA